MSDSTSARSLESPNPRGEEWNGGPQEHEGGRRDSNCVAGIWRWSNNNVIILNTPSCTIKNDQDVKLDGVCIFIQTSKNFFKIARSRLLQYSSVFIHPETSPRSGSVNGTVRALPGPPHSSGPAERTKGSSKQSPSGTPDQRQAGQHRLGTAAIPFRASGGNLSVAASENNGREADISRTPLKMFWLGLGI